MGLFEVVPRAVEEKVPEAVLTRIVESMSAFEAGFSGVLKYMYSEMTHSSM